MASMPKCVHGNPWKTCKLCNTLTGEETMKEYDRATIQQAFDAAITEAAKQLGLDLDNLEGAHPRRVARALFRLGAEYAIDHGAGPEELMALAVESFRAELTQYAEAKPCGECDYCLENQKGVN